MSIFSYSNKFKFNFCVLSKKRLQGFNFKKIFLYWNPSTKFDTKLLNSFSKKLKLFSISYFWSKSPTPTKFSIKNLSKLFSQKFLKLLEQIFVNASSYLFENSKRFLFSKSKLLSTIKNEYLNKSHSTKNCSCFENFFEVFYQNSLTFDFEINKIDYDKTFLKKMSFFEIFKVAINI